MVEVIRKICENLQQFCDGENLDADKVEVVNSLYATIESSDYAGKADLKYLHSKGQQKHPVDNFLFTSRPK